MKKYYNSPEWEFIKLLPANVLMASGIGEGGEGDGGEGAGEGGGFGEE